MCKHRLRSGGCPKSHVQLSAERHWDPGPCDSPAESAAVCLALHHQSLYTTRVTAALQLLAWCPGPWLALLGCGIEDEHFPQLLLCFFPLLRSQFQDWQADSTQVLSRPFRGDSEALPMLLSNGQTWAAAATVFQKPRDVWHLACPLLLSLPVVSLHWATGGGRMLGTLLFCLC